MKKLNDIPKENPFLVPDNYFDELEQDVMAQVHQIQKASHRRRIYTIITAAAAVVALLIAINVWIFSPDNKGQDATLAQESTNNTGVLLASSEDNDVLSNGIAVPTVEFEEVDFDNVDYQILDYYVDEMSDLEYLY
jgi:methylmalonyl-CoA mutase N-terminal domain/subunit